MKKSILYLLYLLIILFVIILIYIITKSKFIYEYFNLENKNNLKIYFVNLDNNIDRWHNNKNKLNNFFRFPAINGKKMNKDQKCN